MKVIKYIFQQNLETAISTSGMTQSQIAQLADVTESMISDYLKGRFSPRPITVIKLAQAMKVDPEWLASGVHTLPTGTGKKVRTSENQIISLSFLTKISKALNENAFKNPELEQKYLELLTSVIRLNVYGLDRLLTLSNDLVQIDKYTNHEKNVVSQLEETLRILKNKK